MGEISAGINYNWHINTVELPMSARDLIDVRHHVDHPCRINYSGVLCAGGDLNRNSQVASLNAKSCTERALNMLAGPTV